MKNWLYRRIVCHNERIRKAYERYVQGHLGEHKKKRWKHWLVLMALAVKYRDSQKGRLHRFVLIKLKNGTAKLRMEKVPGAVCYNLYESLDGVHYRFSKKVNRHICCVSELLDNQLYFFKFKVSLDGIHYSEFSEVLTVSTVQNKEAYFMEKLIENSSATRQKQGPSIKNNVSLDAVKGDDQGIILKWEKIADALHYNIYRTDKNGHRAFLIQTDKESYYDTKVQPGEKYVYKIKYTIDGKKYHEYPSTVSQTAPQSRYGNANSGKLFEKGAESTKLGRISPEHFAKGLLPFDVISFDVFDTLILRPFCQPSDLFILVGEELGIMNFCEIRKRAEEEARQNNELSRGNREVTLLDIYKKVEEETGLEAQRGVQVEFEIEKKICRANPYMLEVFRMLLEKKKIFIAVSDMYLTKKQMEDLMNSCGFYGFDFVFVSCDFNCSKRNGGLFDIVKKKYQGSIVHIGDNMQSDIVSARERGFETRFYENVNEVGREFRAKAMSHLIGSAYKGLVNAKLHNGRKQYSPYYEIGYVYTGIYCMGFCQWIYQYAKENHLDKILFLAREGDLYQKVFQQMYPDFPTEYVLWSRIPVVKTTVSMNRHPFFLQLIHHKANAIYKSRLDILFDRIGIGELKQYFPEYRLNQEEYLTSNNEKIIRSLLIQHWDEVEKCYESDQDYIRAYIIRQLGDAKKAAVVDVGWSGNNVLQIKKLVEESYGLECQIHCLLAAARNVNDTYMAGMMQQGKVKTYLFSNMYNKGLHDSHQEENNRLNSFFFEILTQSATPTFMGFDKQGKFLYDIPEVENYARDYQIHEGTLDFVKDYITAFHNFPYMLDISGHDAYMPFQYFSRNLLWIKKYFGDYIFGRDLFATQEKAIMESVSQVMKNAGLWEEKQ